MSKIERPVLDPCIIIMIFVLDEVKKDKQIATGLHRSESWNEEKKGYFDFLKMIQREIRNLFVVCHALEKIRCFRAFLFIHHYQHILQAFASFFID